MLILFFLQSYIILVIINQSIISITLIGKTGTLHESREHEKQKCFSTKNIIF